MSEQLTIEILREKFKEAQAKGEGVELIHPNNEILIYCVTAIGKLNVLAVSCDGAIEAVISWNVIKHWKIKPPKDEYEVLYENLTFMKELGAYRVGFDKNPLHYIDSSFTGRKLLRNKRTSEITNYDEELLK